MAQRKEDLASRLIDAIRASVDEARKAGPSNIAAAVNVGTDGRSTTVYSDQDVTIVEHDGETQVFRHRQTEADPGEAPGR